MFAFVLAIILLLAAVPAVLISRRTRQPMVLRISGIVSALLGLVLLAASLFYTVPTQEIGIPVTFGKPGPAVTNGIHTKAPWSHVVTMDATIQSEDNEGNRRTDIRLGSQAQAYVQNYLRWRIAPNTTAADSLYRDYKSFDQIAPKLINQELSSALNQAFASYNPLVQGSDTSAYNTIAATVMRELQNQPQIKDRIIIESFVIKKVDFDDATQARIDAYQAEVANTRIADQKERTATAQAQANRILAGSVSKDPNVLVSKCLDMLGEMVAKGQNVPAGFSCWPGGSGTSVIANASTPAK